MNHKGLTYKDSRQLKKVIKYNNKHMRISILFYTMNKKTSRKNQVETCELHEARKRKLPKTQRKEIDNLLRSLRIDSLILSYSDK